MNIKTDPNRILLTKEDIDNEQGGGGLEIKIEGITGDPTDSSPGTAVFIEKYEGQVYVRVWNGEQDPISIPLKPERLFRNFYKCSECGHEWTDNWSCTCNDRCPECNAETEPFKSEDV